MRHSDWISSIALVAAVALMERDDASVHALPSEIAPSSPPYDQRARSFKMRDPWTGRGL
jgi:hypothetical protein